MRSILVLSAAALAAMPAAAQDGGKSFWRSGYGQGSMEYSTGEWDRPYGGALSISCTSGRVLMLPQIKGKGPPPGSVVTFKTSNRSGSVMHRFTADAKGGISLPSATRSPEFVRLWGNLRSRDIVTVGYANGAWEVLSLDGAGKELPRVPCAE